MVAQSVNRRAISVQDAAVQLCAELNRANHGTIKLRFTVPGPFAPSQLKGVTLHNTGMKDAFSISKINILQHGRLILDIISPQEVLPGKSSAPIGISIPEGLLADTSLPLEVEILLTPGNSSGVVEMPPPAEKKRSRNGTD